MKIAVTGGTGFLGLRVVARHLERNDEVRVLSRSPDALLPDGARPVAGDLAALSDDAARQLVDGVDVLYHCAGEIRNPAKMHAVNVAGTRYLAAAAAGRIGRWVHVSSVGVYGPRSRGVVTEEAEISPVGPYERTKSDGERATREAAAAGAFEWVSVRPSIVFGADMPSDFLRQMARAISRGFFFMIGPAGASANLVHVSDVAGALILAGTAEAAVGRVYNVSDWCSMEDLVHSMAEGAGAEPPVLRVPLPVALAAATAAGWLPGSPLTPSRVRALSTRVRYSAERARQDLGWRPAEPLATRVGDVVRRWTA